MKFLDFNQIIEYPISFNKFYRIQTSIIPVIENLEDSHIVYKNVHYGNSFSSDGNNDISKLIIDSIRILINRSLNPF